MKHRGQNDSHEPRIQESTLVSNSAYEDPLLASGSNGNDKGTSFFSPKMPHRKKTASQVEG